MRTEVYTKNDELEEKNKKSPADGLKLNSSGDEKLLSRAATSLRRLKQYGMRKYLMVVVRKDR